MLVYDITNEKSFDNIKNWIRNIEEVWYFTLPGASLCDFCFRPECTSLHGYANKYTINFVNGLQQHASADVERMVLGNKCDVNDKRQVSKERGEKVIIVDGDLYD